MFGPRRERGGEAFAGLVDGVRACVAAGRCGSADPGADAALLWTVLHGVVSLNAAGPRPTGPDLDALLRTLVGRLVLVPELSGGSA